MSGDKEFLTRWSARKREARAAADAPQPEQAAPPAPDTAPLVSAEEAERLSDAELCERLGLPEPATLKQGDDFSAFLDSRVPERLRRVALRRLWRSNPMFNMRDGLDDYDEDFRAAGDAAGAVKTLYRVGEGFAKRLPDEDAPDALVEAPRPEADSAIPENVAMRDICAPECDSDVSDQPAPQNDAAAAPQESDADPDEKGCGRPSQITSRRMSFRFVEKPNRRA